MNERKLRWKNIEGKERKEKNEWKKSKIKYIEGNERKKEKNERKWKWNKAKQINSKKINEKKKEWKTKNDKEKTVCRLKYQFSCLSSSLSFLVYCCSIYVVAAVSGHRS